MSERSLPTVLIVDDDRVNRAMLAELLQQECRVLLAKDGESALRAVALEPEIDLILLDVSMPDMDGYEVLRRLRAERHTAETAVIFITSLSEEQDEEHGLSQGALDYVSKPIRPVIVQARIRNHLRLVSQRKQLEQLALLDSLTGLANRRHFDHALGLAFRRAARTGERLSVAMVDVDHFKKYNDRYGHGAGDEALREVAHVFSQMTRRPYDLAARYGGEEFVLLFSGDVELAALLEQLRANVLALALAHEDSPPEKIVSVSCGGVVLNSARHWDPGESLRRADALLYQAKQQGRNRVVVENI
jgi:diguanylate cyclase (GGDEF)-like protein